MKKKIVILLFALLLVVCLLASFSSCLLAVKTGEVNGNSNTESGENGGNGGNGNGGNGNGGENGNNGAPTAANAGLTGTLNYINLDDRDPSVLRGVTIYGNRAGSDGFNEKAAAKQGIRCVFELNEYVGFIPDTDLTYGITVWVFSHKENQSYYNTCAFSDLTPGFAERCILRFDTDDPESNYWGEFYLNASAFEQGYYDFVFVYEGKAIATMITRFYAEGALETKTDAELEAIMTGQAN